MHLVTYRKGSSNPRVGALVGEAVLDLGALAADLARERATVRHGRGGFPKTMLDLIARGPDGLAAAREALAHGEALLKRDGVAALAERKLGVAADKARLEAPIPRPTRNVFCLGRNYKEHAAERGAEAPTDPVYFTKAPECVLAPGGKIVHHAVTQQLDYEVELTVVIGAAGRDIPREQALAHVFGYTIVNDVTARDLQKRHQQWFKGKSLDTFCPMGPVLVTADEIPDPQTLAIAMRVNGETRQSSHTSKMIFPVDECIAVLSQGFTLLPGDVIATGTPEGVGAALGKFLKKGDKLEAEVDGFRADAAAPGDVRGVVDAVVDRWQRVDVLVNNAGGFATIRATEDITDAEWESILRSNLTSVFVASRAVLPVMKRQRAGRIVNVSSVVARGGAARRQRRSGDGLTSIRRKESARSISAQPRRGAVNVGARLPITVPDEIHSTAR